MQLNLSCVFRIINLNSNMVIGLRIRKFSVGKFDVFSKKCSSSWIEIEEADLDKYDLENYGLVTKKIPAKKGNMLASSITQYLVFQLK